MLQGMHCPPRSLAQEIAGGTWAFLHCNTNYSLYFWSAFVSCSMSPWVTLNLLDEIHGCIKTPLNCSVCCCKPSAESGGSFSFFFLKSLYPLYSMLQTSLGDVFSDWQTSYDVDPSTTMSALTCWQSLHPYPSCMPSIQHLYIPLSWPTKESRKHERERCADVCVCVWQTHQANRCTMVDFFMVVLLLVVWVLIWRHHNLTRRSHHHSLRGVPGIHSC